MRAEGQKGTRGEMGRKGGRPDIEGMDGRKEGRQEK